MYHWETDLFEIGRFVVGLGLEYELYPDHFTLHKEETVLFAWPRVRGPTA